MGILDKLTNTNRKISEDEVLEAFREACWDLYVANLPDPVILDGDEKKNQKKLPDSMKDSIPRGMSIDPDTWTVYFNTKDMPESIPPGELKKFARAVLQHEVTHYTLVPADKVTEAILVDSALKGFGDQSILKDKDRAQFYSRITMNIMGDLIGDTCLESGKYGRENFSDITVWRNKEIIGVAGNAMQTPSALWQTLVSAYEKLWKKDLGLKKYAPQLNPLAEKASNELAKILGKNMRKRETWEEKIKQCAEALEPVLKETEKEAKQGNQSKQKKGKGKEQGQGQGQGQQSNQGQNSDVPYDVVMQMGDPTQSPLGEKENGENLNQGNGNQEQNQGRQNKNGQDEQESSGGISIDERVLDEIYERNKNSPGHFAGTMAALHGIEPDDALRLMYRARAKELLMKIKEEENQKKENVPSYHTSWNPGDPVVGKGGLEIERAIMNSGKPIPGLNTEKRKFQESEGYGTLKMIPDIFIVIDSSGSMDWRPWDNPPDARGSFDKAILAAEGAALYAIENGGKVAVINHSAGSDIKQQDFTRNINSVEKAIMHQYAGGTTLPCKEVLSMIKKTQNPLLTCYMSDCELSNPDQACDDAFAHAITEYDNLAVFNIGGGGTAFVNKIKEKKAIVYVISKIQDLAGLMIGEVKKKYKEAKKHANR